MDKYCQNCHQPNPPDALFCRSCAAPLSQGANAGQYANQQWNPQNQAAQNFAQTAPDKASGRAVAALVLTICAFCCAFFTGIPAAILGWMEINDIKAGNSSPKGMRMAQIGLWGGIALSILGAIGWVLMFLFGMVGGRGY
ncbi:MAG: DUF4190 domain-containing protein [Pyrinomonadaceae bacterium]